MLIHRFIFIPNTDVRFITWKRFTGPLTIFGGGRIRIKVGTCSYEETFEYEWSSYFLIWADDAGRMVILGSNMKVPLGSKSC
jgi:hypothetical protein